MPNKKKLVAGKELDALMAAGVMGWTIRKAKTRGWGAAPKGTLFVNTPGYMQYVIGVEKGWTPSTNIVQALTVVDAMSRHKDGWMLTLQNWKYYGSKSWTARFTSHPLGPNPVEARADTAPEAICLAAAAVVLK